MASNSTSSSSSSLSDFAHTIFSYNTNIMLAALISLLLVVLFVLLLHAYANCFFPRPRPRPPTVSYVLPPPRLDRLPFHDSPSTPSKGLHPSLISTIPLFVYQSQNDNNNNNNNNNDNKSATPMDCVICLTEFQDREMGRRLSKCAHAFHLHCIDMWLASHANCPVCRAPALPDNTLESDIQAGDIHMEPAHRNSCEIIQRGNNEHHNGTDDHFYSSSSSSSDPPLTSLVASLKRMMSRNRTEGRIFPASSNAHELDVPV